MNTSIVDPNVEFILRRLWFDKLFLGARAISIDFTICSIDIGQAMLNAKMLARSDGRSILTGTTELGQTPTYAVVPLFSATDLIANSSITKERQQRLTNVGIDLTTVGNSGEAHR